MNQHKAAQAAHTAIIEASKRVVRSKSPQDTPRWIFRSIPYLKAIRANDYGLEDPEMCVLYALNNMVGWKGDVARQVKKELNEAIK